MCKLRLGTVVGLMRGFPHICCYFWATIGHRPPTRVAAFPVFPSATRWVSIGRPTSSPRTLTTGAGT